MNNKIYTILSGHSEKQKKQMIKFRLLSGWKCYINRITGIRHIWIPPKSEYIRELIG